MEHLGETLYGVEYQFDIKLDPSLTDVETVNRIKVEVKFTGKTKKLMNVDHMRKALQLKDARNPAKIYEVRIPSLYRPDLSEEDQNYLLKHTDEVHVDLFVDDEKVRSLM